jgi:hypothetical protein
MSTPVDLLYGLDTTTERRFYPRINATRPLYVPFGVNNLTMLLNLSENGMLVSTREALNLNSVFRVSIHLNGLPQPFEVHVRTVWTDESKERAGIQLLDLSDHDREQIRKWGGLELLNGWGETPAASHSATSLPAAETITPPEQPAVSVETPTTALPSVPASAPENPEVPPYFASTVDAPPFAAASTPVNFPASHASVVPRSRHKSRAPAMVAWGAVAAVVCLGVALFLDRGLAEQLLGRPIPGATQIATSTVSSDLSPVSKVESTAPTDGHPTPIENLPLLHMPGSPQNQADASIAAAQPTKHQPTREPIDNIVSAPVAVRDAVDSSNAVDASNAKSTSISSPIASPSARGTAPTAGTGSAPDAVANKPASKPAATTPTPAPSLVATNTQPSTSSAVAASTPLIGASTASNSSGLTAPKPSSSAIVGSIGNSASSAANAAPHPDTLSPVAPNSVSTSANSPISSSGSSSGWPVSGPPVAAGKTRTSLFHSRPADASSVVQMDVNPGPVMAITPPRGIGSSFVTIPGERVVDSPGMTVHVRRAVRVPSERWIWSRRKQLAMGELATRIDPQAAHQPASGSITVQAMIDKEGRVTDLKPLNGSFSFLPGVARAVREWRYEPTYLDGKAVETRAEIEIDFHAPSAVNRP